MVGFRIVLILVLLWAMDVLLFAVFPSVRLALDPLLVGFLYLGIRFPAEKPIWGYGFLLGCLKDLFAQEPFGAWAVSFALIGWLLVSARSWMEWEDAWMVGVWAAVLTLAATVIHSLWLLGADPSFGGAYGQWLALPFSMVIHGTVLAWAFPKLERWVGRSGGARYR